MLRGQSCFDYTMFAKFVLLLFAVVHCTNALKGSCEVKVDTLECSNLQDSDLPLTGFDGSYTLVLIKSGLFTTLPKNSFGGVMAEKYAFYSNDMLTEIEAGFLGDNAVRQIDRFEMAHSEALKSFPWNDLSQFSALTIFILTHTGIETMDSDIPWPVTVQHIDLGYNSIATIPPHAFSAAQHLVSLTMWSFGPDNGHLTIESNGLHITSAHSPKLATYSYASQITLKDNAFGNVDGGHLWGEINMRTQDFPEGVFRLMLKSHFDKGHSSLLADSFGVARVADCSSCDIAWLYKDAEQFNKERYIQLVGQNNVICDGIGPVLETDHPGFIQQMNNCPHTPMPWPGPNVCEGVPETEDTTADPENCHCFYQCSYEEIHGHECCEPGLAYNPVLNICDWAVNVPNCD